MTPPTFHDPRQPTEYEFRYFVDYLFQAKRAGADGWHHAASGLAGEAAEVMDHTKKHWVYGREIDYDKLEEELGDTIHYFMMLLLKISERERSAVTISDIMANNVAKLQKRYPNGFTKEAAIARADKV